MNTPNLQDMQAQPGAAPDAIPQADGAMNEPDPNSPDGEDGVPASPEEQAQYDHLVTSGLAMLYDQPDTAMSVAKKLKSEAESKGGISVSIGQQTATIMLSLVRGLKQQGLEADPDVVLNAGMELLAEIAASAEKAGLVPEAQRDKIMEDAAYQATTYYGDQEQKAGHISPETREEAKQVMASEMQKNPQAGSLAAMARQPQPAQAAPPQAQPQGAM